MMLAALYGLLVGLVEAWTRSRVFESLDFMEAKFEEAFTRENKFEIKLYGPSKSHHAANISLSWFKSICGLTQIDSGPWSIIWTLGAFCQKS